MSPPPIAKIKPLKFKTKGKKDRPNNYIGVKRKKSAGPQKKGTRIATLIPIPLKTEVIDEPILFLKFKL